MELDDIEEEDPDELERQMNAVQEEFKEEDEHAKGSKSAGGSGNGSVSGGWDQE